MPDSQGRDLNGGASFAEESSMTRVFIEDPEVEWEEK